MGLQNLVAAYMGIACVVVAVQIPVVNALSQDINNDKEMFKKLLKTKHAMQVDAVKSILGQVQDQSKQYKMLELVINKIIEVMSSSQNIYQANEFVPGESEWPKNETVKEAVALTIENTLLFGELLLRLPHVTRKILKKNSEGVDLVKWNIGFCQKTNLLDNKMKEMLHLASQEIGLVPKEESFINPYDIDKLKQVNTEPKPKVPKVKRKSKEPHLSKPKRTEL